MDCWGKLNLISQSQTFQDKHVLLYGPPGTGKTMSGAKVLPKAGQEVYQLHCHEEMCAADVWGFMAPNAEGGISWLSGPMALAWNSGGVIVVNEIDQAGSSAQISLLAALDDVQVAGFTTTDGKTIRPQPGFRAIATTNETPESLPEALKDRFALKLLVDMPCPEALESLGDFAEVTRDNYSDSDNTLFDYREIWRFSQGFKEGHIGPKVLAELVWGERGAAVLDHLVMQVEAVREAL